MEKVTNYYEVLGVPVGTPIKECFEAYKTKIAKVHPDFEGQDSFTGFNEQECLALNEAVMTVGNYENKEGRDAYDVKLKEYLNSTMQTNSVPPVQNINQSWFKKNKNAIIAFATAAAMTVGVMSWLNKKDEAVVVPANEPPIETPNEKPETEQPGFGVEYLNLTEADFDSLCLEFERQAVTLGLNLQPNEIASAVYIANISHFDDEALNGIFTNYFNNELAIDQIVLEGTVAMLHLIDAGAKNKTGVNFLADERDNEFYKDLEAYLLEALNATEANKDVKMAAVLARAESILGSRQVNINGQNISSSTISYGAEAAVFVLIDVIGNYGNIYLNEQKLGATANKIIETSSGNIQEIMNDISNREGLDVDTSVEIERQIELSKAGNGYVLTDEEIKTLETISSLYYYKSYLTSIQEEVAFFAENKIAETDTYDNEGNKSTELFDNLAYVHSRNILTCDMGGRTN